MSSELDRAMDRFLVQFEELKDAQKNARFYVEALVQEDERKSARIRQLESQLAAARDALEPFATGETTVSYIPFEHFRTAARVWHQLSEPKVGNDGRP